MINIKEIRNTITSIEHTKKITKTMELISASKMKKSKNNMQKSVPYEEVICKIIKNITHSGLEHKHNFFIKRKIKNVGYILISSDRGLCGNLNTNLFKKVLIDIKKWNKKGIKSIFSIIGTKGISYFYKIGIKIIAQVTSLKEKPSLSKLIGIIKVMIDLYEKNKIDILLIANNKFINNIQYIPQINKILPLKQKLFYKENNKIESWDYLYEPDSKELLDILLPRYVEFQIYQKVLENITSEQSARMFSMKSASDNAESVIKDLQLFHNKNRQANITQELNEIISGTLLI